MGRMKGGSVQPMPRVRGAVAGAVVALAVVAIAIGLGLGTGLTQAVASPLAPGASHASPSFSPTSTLSKTKPTVLVSPKPQKNGEFGSAVAVSGSIAVVGAPFDKVGSSVAGRAFIFNTATGAKFNLTSPNSHAQLEGFYGWSVAVSGTIVAVGAPHETAGVSPDTEPYSGHVYLYNATTGHRTRTLSAPTIEDDQTFGASVAIAGTTIVVGTPGESGGGAVYLFSSKTGNLLSTLNPPSGLSSGAQFGEIVAINGTTVAVGAPLDTVSGITEAGAAFTFSATTAALGISVVSPSPSFEGQFGASLALSTTKLAVGAPGETNGTVYEVGNAYTFNLKSGLLSASLRNPVQTAGGHLGSSIAIAGSTVVVGADDNSAWGVYESGEAFAYTASTGAYLYNLTSSRALSGGFFGYSAAMSGKAIVIGAPFETSKGRVGAGNAYLF